MTTDNRISDREFRPLLVVDDNGNARTVTVWGAAVALYDEYYETDFDHDGHVAGVFADWLQDNLEEISALNPHITAGSVLRKIDLFRSHFHNPSRNKPVQERTNE